MRRSGSSMRVSRSKAPTRVTFPPSKSSEFDSAPKHAYKASRSARVFDVLALRVLALAHGCQRAVLIGVGHALAHDLDGPPVGRRQVAVREARETPPDILACLLLQALPFAAGPALVAVPQAGLDQTDGPQGIVEVGIGALDLGQRIGLRGGLGDDLRAGRTPQGQGGRK